MRGRKPKPRRAGEGLPVARPVEVVEASRLAPPPTLPPEGRPVWEAAVRDYGEILRESDLPLLEAWVVAVVRRRQAQALIASEGLLTESASGELRVHPAVRIERDEAMLEARLGDQLGLSPSARTRLSTMVALGQSALLAVQERVDALMREGRRRR